MKRIVLASCLLFPALANATIAATSENLLCASSDVVLAKVTEVGDGECQRNILAPADCDMVDVPLTIEVTKVIGRYAGKQNYVALTNLNVGSVLYVSATVDNIVPKVITNGVTSFRHVNYGRVINEQPTNQLLSVAEVNRLFAGKEFIFAVTKFKREAENQRLNSFVWTSDRAEWAEQTLEKSNNISSDLIYCPKLDQK